MPFEVLRLEARLGDKNKLKRELEKIDKTITDYTFKSLFKAKYSKEIILNILLFMKENYPKLLNTEESDLPSFVNNILINNPYMKLKTLLAIVGYKVIVHNVGVRGFRNMIRKFSDNSWYTLKKKITNIN